MSDSADLFERETTASLSMAGIYRLMILQELDQAFRSFRLVLVARDGRSDKLSALNVFKSHLRSLLLMVHAAWERSNKKKLDDAEARVGSDPFLTFGLLISFLDDVGLIRFDDQHSYNRTLVAKSNKFHGYM